MSEGFATFRNKHCQGGREEGPFGPCTNWKSGKLQSTLRAMRTALSDTGEAGSKLFYGMAKKPALGPLSSPSPPLSWEPLGRLLPA